MHLKKLSDLSLVIENKKQSQAFTMRLTRTRMGGKFPGACHDLQLIRMRG
jgi:hypothetical protein